MGQSPLRTFSHRAFSFFQLKLYQLVIEDVVTNVRDAFLDEGVDEQVLQEMKQIWTNRLMASKAVEVTPEPQTPMNQPAILANNPKVSHARRVLHKLSCVNVNCSSNNDRRKVHLMSFSFSHCFLSYYTLNFRRLDIRRYLLSFTRFPLWYSSSFHWLACMSNYYCGRFTFITISGSFLWFVTNALEYFRQTEQNRKRL